VSQSLDPGSHEVHVDGFGRDEHLTVVLKEGERKEIDFERPLSEADTSPAAPAPPKPHSTTGLGLVVVSVGIGSFLLSGVAVALMYDAKKRADEHCFGTECDKAGIDATEAGKSYGTLGAVAFGAGVVGVSLGTFLYLNGRSQRDATEPRPPQASLSLRPLVSPSGGGLVFGGTL
jgi:hypothetical protein